MIWSSIASRFEAFIPFASVATKATSAIPIISAAAVAAVRPGLRTEFPRASVPAAPPIRARAARRPRRAAARARDEIIATPTNSSSTPPAIERSRCGRVDVVGEHRVAEQEQRERRSARAAIERREAARRATFGSVAPSRTAAIGGTRVARIAGKSPATTVTSDADEERDDDRARREDGLGRRQLEPERPEERLRAPFARARPERRAR